ncbi:MAG: NUDIX hydrolase [Parvibaculaceae bacterium]|nr:NUDIX hydrolase [Parvibaculaceae bacterium]
MSETANSTFDAKESRGQELREKNTLAVRPREAATLIIVRHDGPRPRILMGQRHENHKFMPNKFVFPGGRLDAADTRIKAVEDLSPATLDRLMKRMRGKPSPSRARALALAAIRETFEETGLVLGRKVEKPMTSKNKDWADYFLNGVAPALGKMEFIARAITPPYRSKRFDTRFFIADAELVQGDLQETRGSGELLGLHWLTVDDAKGLDLPNITRVILDELDERLALPVARQAERPVPFVFFRNGNPVREHL